jgi:transposase
MAAKQKTMLQIRLILQKRLQGDSIRSICRDISIARLTVRKYLRQAASCPLSLVELLNLADDELASCLLDNPGPQSVNQRKATLEAWLTDEDAKAQFNKPGVTRQLLWEEYRSAHSDGYGFTQFCHYFNRLVGLSQVTTHFQRYPGEKFMADFSGKKMGYVDTSTGEYIECEVFVGILPFSNLIYAQAVASQQQCDFVKAIGEAFEYLGGVPKSILCDNLKSAVKKSDRYEPAFTELIEQLCLHYQTTFMATRPRKPRDKASVEGAVQIVYQRVFAPLRNHVFHSIESLNEAIGNKLDGLNQRVLTKQSHSRVEFFSAEEKTLLHPLPNQLFEVRRTVQAKVQKNYHIILGED